ncbi:HNH endonuclease [Aestuariispira insulae]|uniref:Putative restriction endonuclease n=1 Tax=Aestuariispira insulae TaxID=1461337 RepID=A0A3D9HHT6_9PROT|nr:HNH endonuclease [Aestuariispira insulae]RED49038.1 putative restriction endonuclease [Aestuariispira insulae]
MVKAVFSTKILPDYDDLPEIHYHFPCSYLNQVSQAIGDWILYSGPRRSSGDLMSAGGRQRYFATARLVEILPDPVLEDHHYARVEGYLEFDRPVMFRQGGDYYESNLQKADGSTNKGAFGRSVRLLEDLEYDRILKAGFRADEMDFIPDISEDGEEGRFSLGEETATFDHGVTERPMVERLQRRRFRDHAFARQVKQAYGNQCGITGWKIINGGGRPEVQAAHIRPVADKGPDSIRNGIALSGTVHWMFDRGLISLEDDFTILTAKDKVPDTIDRLIRKERKLILPENPDFRPHPRFLDYHRRVVFKG